MIKWTRTSRLSIKISLSLEYLAVVEARRLWRHLLGCRVGLVSTLNPDSGLDHTVDYDPCIKSQLSFTQLTSRRCGLQIWSRPPLNSRAQNIRRPPCGCRGSGTWAPSSALLRRPALCFQRQHFGFSISLPGLRVWFPSGFHFSHMAQRHALP